MAKVKKTFFQMEVDDENYEVKYNGSFDEPKTREERKHNERIMRALIADDRLLTLFYNLVMPVVRMKRREAKRKRLGSDAPSTGQNEG